MDALYAAAVEGMAEPRRHVGPARRAAGCELQSKGLKTMPSDRG